MTALPTAEHVRAFLRVHMETSAYDAAHSDLADQEQLGQRYSLWQSCIDHLELLETNEAYAQHFADLVMRHSVATAHAGDPAAYREALDELGLGDHRFDDCTPAPSLEAVKASGQVAHVMALVGRIRPRLRHLPISWWDIHETEIDVIIDTDDVLEARAVLDSLCRILGLTFRAHLRTTDGRVKMAAEGVIDGVQVGFWKIADAGEPAADPAFRFAPGARPAIRRPDRDRYAAGTRVYKLAARLQKQVPNRCWWFVHGDLDVMLRGTEDIAAARAELAAIAARFGLDYTDTEHTKSDPTARFLCARGTIDGVPVEFWTICHDYTPTPTPVDGGEIDAGEECRRVEREKDERMLWAQDEPEEHAAEEYVEPVDDGMQVRFTVNGPGDYEATLEPDGPPAAHDLATCPECVDQYEAEQRSDADYAASLEPGIEADL